MRTKARSARHSRALERGMKVYDGMTGEELFKNDPSTRTQRGMFLHKNNFDFLTDIQRQLQLDARLR